MVVLFDKDREVEFWLVDVLFDKKGGFCFLCLFSLDFDFLDYVLFDDVFDSEGCLLEDRWEDRSDFYRFKGRMFFITHCLRFKYRRFFPFSYKFVVSFYDFYDLEELFLFVKSKLYGFSLCREVFNLK